MKRIDDSLGHRADGRPGIQQGSKCFPLSLLIGPQLRLGYSNREESLSIDDVSA